MKRRRPVFRALASTLKKETIVWIKNPSLHFAHSFESLTGERAREMKRRFLHPASASSDVAEPFSLGSLALTCYNTTRVTESHTIEYKSHELFEQACAD
ncbi:hypothetical protein PRIPAC_73838 [Pristionchus pacificus]|uniref:Uncharacterized protein n=1 Tax=Pristionchus pacificus TaxID=54126 RepID=A0A2A6C810_PRIPA|nr:hypothetical protein PRIPAC_73838 [Pristionchus pacificus]|eukprot:PDM74183.1 hypothetical protein PRIPAC_41539 [Pristionchus pacificus]